MGAAKPLDVLVVCDPDPLLVDCPEAPEEEPAAPDDEEDDAMLPLEEAPEAEAEAVVAAEQVLAAEVSNDAPAVTGTCSNWTWAPLKTLEVDWCLVLEPLMAVTSTVHAAWVVPDSSHLSETDWVTPFTATEVEKAYTLLPSVTVA